MAARGFWRIGNNESKLLELYKTGLSYRRIADHFNVSKHAVMTKLFRLGVERRAKRTPHIWTEERLARLRELADGTRTIAEVATELGTSHQAVANRARSLRGYRFKRRNGSWNSDLDAKLIEMSRQRLSFSAIAKELGITRAAVAGRLHRLGIKQSREQHAKNVQKAMRRLAKKKKVANGNKEKRQGGTELTDLPPETQGVTAIPFMEILEHRRRCRWPVEGSGYRMICCGATTEADTYYCTAHNARSRQRRTGPSKPFILKAIQQTGLWAA